MPYEQIELTDTVSTPGTTRTSNDPNDSPHRTFPANDGCGLASKASRSYWRVVRVLVVLVAMLALAIAVSAPSVAARQAPGGDTGPRTVPTLSTPPVSPCCVIVIKPSVYSVTIQATLSVSGAQQEFDIPCQMGDTMLSGGWSIPLRSDVSVTRSSRKDAGTWWLFILHSTPVTAVGYAMCLHNALGTVTERAATTTVQPGSFGFANAGCNAGEVVVGGGFNMLAAQSQGIEITYDGPGSYPTTTLWGITGVSHRVTAGPLTGMAECLSVSGSHPMTVVAQGVIVNYLNTGSVVSPACPNAYTMTGGGYWSDPGFHFTNAPDGGGTVWTVSIYGETNPNLILRSVAICLKL